MVKISHCAIGALWALASSSTSQAQTGLTFRNLDACLASEAQTKAEADKAETALKAISQPISQEFSDALTERNKLLSRLSGIRSACSKLRIAAKANNGDLKKEPLASEVSQMNELHELLSDNVLKAVPSATTRKIQEQNLSGVRSQMADLAKIMDNSLDAMGKPLPASAGPTSANSRLVGRPDPAVGGGVLGAEAAASLTADVSEWNIKEAARQEQLRAAEAARRVQEARIAAEQQRLAQARYQAELAAAEEQRQNSDSAVGSFFSGLIQGAVGAYMATQGSGFAGLPQMGTGRSGGLGSAQCQQLLDQIASDRSSLASMSTLTSAEAADVRRVGQEAIASNQQMYNQNCR